MHRSTLLVVGLLSGAAGFAPAGRAPSRPASLQLRPAPCRTTPLQLAEQKTGSSPLFFLDIGTKGGIVFYSVVGIAAPFFAYNYMLEELEWDIVLAGNVILVAYVGLATVLWTASYVFRVANKDMTYAQQLRDYENAVIQKRFEELSTEEVDALMGEIYPGSDGSKLPPKK